MIYGTNAVSDVKSIALFADSLSIALFRLVFAKSACRIHMLPSHLRRQRRQESILREQIDFSIL